MAQALRQDEDGQLALYGKQARIGRTGDRRPETHDKRWRAPVCSGCRTREARYGFRDEHADPSAIRPRTLCFDCFRMEIDWRQDVAARLARGWNAAQVRLPLDATLNALTRRRRRAQIAARHALELSNDPNDSNVPNDLS